MKLTKEKKMAKTTTLVIISFIVLIIVGGLLLNLPISNMPGKPHNLLDSLFTATASVCVAGLSTVCAAEQYTVFGQIVMLILIQIGALGFIFIMSVFMLLIKRKLSYKDQINLGTVLRYPRKTKQN